MQRIDVAGRTAAKNGDIEVGGGERGFILWGEGVSSEFVSLSFFKKSSPM
jgi:hypothetical protein